MKSIKDIIYNTITVKQEKNWHLDLIKNWPNIARGLEKYLTIYKIVNNTLTLEVNDSSWLQEIYLLSPIILTRIQQFCPMIKKIKVQKNNNPKYLNDDTALPKNKITLNEKNLVKDFKDQELANYLLNYFAICHQ